MVLASGLLVVWRWAGPHRLLVVRHRLLYHLLLVHHRLLYHLLLVHHRLLHRRLPVHHRLLLLRHARLQKSAAPEKLAPEND
jgi:hypothetical protein